MATYQNPSNPSGVVVRGILSPPIYLMYRIPDLSPKKTKLEGIIINNKEHKASQYADDTSVFLKASVENLKNCLNTLDWFYYKSGLKININKTKVIRIGPIRESDRRFCHENVLDWVSKFTALGINYDIMHMSNITIINIENEIEYKKTGPKLDV